jgi:hypothetical protein
MPAMRNELLGVTVATAALALLGCDGKKGEECAVMLAAANTDVAALKAAVAAKPAAGAKELPAALRAIADAADKLAVDVSKKGPATAELQKASGEYQAVATAISTPARDYADSVDHLAAATAKTRPDLAEPGLKALTAAHDTVKQRCASSPVFECKAITALTESLSANKDKPEALRKLDVDLGKVKVKDKALVALIATLRSSITSVAQTLRDITDAGVDVKATEEKIKAVSGALDAALAKEAPVTERLNAFCSK